MPPPGKSCRRAAGGGRKAPQTAAAGGGTKTKVNFMESILAVFRSRSQAYDYIARLKSRGISACAVSTPREANVGCGISARIGPFDLSRARRALAGGNYSAFVGFFRAETRFGKVYVYPA